MIQRRDHFSEMEDVTSEELNFLRSVYDVTEPLGESRERRNLIERINASSGGDASASWAAQRRGSEAIAEAVVEVLSRDARDRRERNRELLRVDGQGSDVDQLADLHLILDAMQLEAHGTVRYGGDYSEMAAADILQSATTTTEAITVLLRHGLALDAEARWRGLHELACATTLLADDTDPLGISARYLAHGKRLPLDDPAYAEVWAQEPAFPNDYEWLRASHGNVSKKGTAQRFTQRWLFDNAKFVSAPFEDWVKLSHSPVHMSSAAVARGRKFGGSGDPAGFDADAVRQICWQVSCSVYELATSVTLLLAGALAPERLVAWSDEFHRRADQLCPGPRLRP